MPQENQLNADKWFTSLVRALKEHVNEGIVAEMGAGLVDVVIGHPGADELAVLMPEPKPVISFEADDIDTTTLGFGDDVVKSEVLVVGADNWLLHEEGKRHVVNFDIGVWCSDAAGGYTACMRVYEVLQGVLGSSRSRKNFSEASNGVSILNFTGGRIVTDKVNDIRTFRLVDAELVVRVFSRTANEPGDERETEGIVQEPGLTVDELVLEG